MQREMIILGLGSNVGDRLHHLRQAHAALAQWVEELRCSAVYESGALLPENAPGEWNMPYYNAVCAGYTQHTPREVLLMVKNLEAATGRIDRGEWGPREIDIDLLGYGGLHMQTEDLIIPHARLTERGFALVPLADVAPDWVHPVALRPARELAAPFAGSVRKTEHTL